MNPGIVQAQMRQPPQANAAASTGQSMAGLMTPPRAGGAPGMTPPPTLPAPARPPMPRPSPVGQMPQARLAPGGHMPMNPGVIALMQKRGM